MSLAVAITEEATQAGGAAQTVRRDKLTGSEFDGWTAEVVDGELTWSLR